MNQTADKLRKGSDYCSIKNFLYRWCTIIVLRLLSQYWHLCPFNIIIQSKIHERGESHHEKKNVISLIKYYAEKNDAGFRNEAYEIAKDFDSSGDYQLSAYIMSLLSNVNTFVPQISENASPFLKKSRVKKICYCFQMRSPVICWA